MWDYAEDWSREFVREVHPFTLIGAPTIAVEAFWTIVWAIEAEENDTRERDEEVHRLAL
jgi:hypothetical protein